MDRILCPKCSSENFKRNRAWVYCGNCYYTLTKDERKAYLNSGAKFDKTSYNKKYYSYMHEGNAGLTLSQVAILRFCTYDHVRKNIHRFDIIPETSPLRVKFNEKIFNWRKPK